PPLRVIGAYRDTEVGPRHPLATLLGDLAHAGLATQRTLAPLEEADAGRLLDAVLAEQGAPAGGDSGRAPGVRRAGGGRLLVVSWGQALRAGLDAAGAGGPVGVPWDVAQGLRQRLAALPESGQELLGVAAIVGREAPRALLLAVAGRAEQEVVAALEGAAR